MSELQDKRILLGVSGGIAAYKAVELARLLVKAGAQVRVAMTEAAQAFIRPLCFQAVTGDVVACDLFSDVHASGMGHIELAQWADIVLVAPATADRLARLAHGLADDLLGALCLATQAPLVVAPAMNTGMWRHPATQENKRLLQARGVRFLGPGIGEQACGMVGPGRMLEPEAIVAALEKEYGEVPNPLAGQRVLMTAGPTREPMDPVRYLSNRSSGKMGFQLAAAFRRAGAKVCLISGPVALATPPGVERVDVETALQMHQAVLQRVAEYDIFVACAAVSDYRPRRPLAQKRKKTQGEWQLDLVRNPDILAEVAALPDGPFTVGFAAETQHLLEYAREKLQRKGLDMLAANPVGEGLGFEADHNELWLLWPGGQMHLPRQDKGRLATVLVEQIAKRYFGAKRNKEEQGGAL